LLVGTDDLRDAPATPDGGDASVADASPEGAAPAPIDGAAATVKVIASRTTQLTAAQWRGSAPAGVKPNDLLFAFLRLEGICDVNVAGWETLGTGQIADQGGLHRAWAGIHALATDESELSTWEFPSCSGPTGTVIMLAFRGARRNQPIATALIKSPDVTCKADGVTGILDGEPLRTPALSLPFFAVAVLPDVPMPDMPGLIRDEMTSGTAIYHAITPPAQDGMLPALRWEVPGVCNTRYFAGSFSAATEP
jgi:hypothetical protein